MASILSSAGPRWWLPDSSSHSPFGDQNLSVWQATAYNRSYYDSTDWISDPYDYYSVVKMNDSFIVGAMNRTEVDFPEYQLAIRLWRWISPLLIIIGTFGNVLSFFTLRSCTFRKCSIAFTLSALAVVDTSVLYTALLRQWLMNMPGQHDVRLLGSFSCKLHMFLTYYLCQLSSWTLVVVTAERAVCISMPFMARTACTKSRIVGSWVLVATILAIINSHLLWITEFVEFKQLQPDNRTIIVMAGCFAGVPYRPFFYNLYYWLDLLLLSTIPFVIIIVGNIIIAFYVFRAMEFRRQQAIPITPSSPPFSQSSTLSTPSQTEAYKPLTSSTTMLIGISMLFLVTTTPSAIYFLKSDELIGDGSDPKRIARTQLIFTVTYLLCFANNSLNFLLYCLTGSRFRRAFVDHFRREGGGVVSRTRRMSRGVLTIGTRSSNCNGNIGIQLQPTTEDRNH